MWFKSKNVQLNIMGKSFDFSWEELGTFMAELALQNASSDIEYIKNKCPSIVGEIQKKVSPIIMLSVSFHLSMLQHGLLFCKHVNNYPYFSEIQKGIKDGLLNLGNNNQKLFTPEHLEFLNQFIIDYIKQYNKAGFNRGEYGNTAIGHSSGYFHAHNICSIYSVDTPENLPLKYMLAEYFDIIYLELLENYYSQESMKCYKCKQSFRSMWATRNPWAKHCKNCDYELK